MFLHPPEPARADNAEREGPFAHAGFGGFVVRDFYAALEPKRLGLYARDCAVDDQLIALVRTLLPRNRYPLRRFGYHEFRRACAPHPLQRHTFVVLQFGERRFVDDLSFTQRTGLRGLLTRRRTRTSLSL